MTHRLNIVGEVDAVMVLANGAIQAYGPREQVMNSLPGRPRPVVRRSQDGECGGRMSNDTLALAPAGTATPMLRAEPIAVALDVAPLPNADYRSMLRLGLWVLLVGFGGFLLWAFLAPLDEGIPAPGLVSVESSRKRVDHASGGIIEQILVREGQTVRAGDPLLELNETQWRSAVQATRSQYQTALATLSRLRAERDGAAAIAFPAELAATTDSEVLKIIAAQTGLVPRAA